VSGTNSGPSVLHGLVRDGEFSQIVSNHLGLDFNLVEGLVIVDSDDGSGHLGDDDHAPEVGLHNLGLLVDGGFLLLLTQLLDQGHGLPLHPPGELPPDSAGEELHELLASLISTRGFK